MTNSKLSRVDRQRGQVTPNLQMWFRSAQHWVNDFGSIPLIEKQARFHPQRRCWRQFVNVRYWPIADIPFCAAQGVLAIADEIID